MDMRYNRDDHAKNFSFLMNESGEWERSPSYDITFSNGPGGEQSTTVMGEGKKPDVTAFNGYGAHSRTFQEIRRYRLSTHQRSLKVVAPSVQRTRCKKNEHTADCQKVGCNGCPLG